MDDDEYVYQEDTMTMTGRFSGTTYSMGMPVRVTLVKADKERREVDFVLGEIHSPLNLEKRQEPLPAPSPIPRRRTRKEIQSPGAKRRKAEIIPFRQEVLHEKRKIGTAGGSEPAGLS